MATTERTEMVQALRTAFPDAKSMPDDVKKFIDKYEVQNSKQITTEMHRATTTMGKARKTLHGLLDAKAKHRTAWLRHLRALLETLQKQVDASETQQKDYQDRINAARREVQTSRRTLQRLNAQAAEAALPETLIEEEDVETVNIDGEDRDLKEQVTILLNKCLKASDLESIDILSDEEDMAASPVLKRPRSREPGLSDVRSS